MSRVELGRRAKARQNRVVVSKTATMKTRSGLGRLDATIATATAAQMAALASKWAGMRSVVMAWSG